MSGEESEEGNDDDDDEDESAPASSNQLHRRQDLSEDDFRHLLVDIANWHGEYLNMLRVLLRDHVNDRYKLGEITTVMDLLWCLIGSGKLSRTNLTILYDIVKVTGQAGFISTIKDKLPSFQNITKRVSTFKSHRLKLLEIGKALTHSDVATLDGRYNSKLKKYKDSWSLMMDLEDKGKLSEGNKMNAFIEVLREHGICCAVKFFHDGYKMKPHVLKGPHSSDQVVQSSYWNQISEPDDAYTPDEETIIRSPVPTYSEMAVWELMGRGSKIRATRASQLIDSTRAFKSGKNH